MIQWVKQENKILTTMTEERNSLKERTQFCKKEEGKEYKWVK